MSKAFTECEACGGSWAPARCDSCGNTTDDPAEIAAVYEHRFYDDRDAKTFHACSEFCLFDVGKSADLWLALAGAGYKEADVVKDYTVTLPRHIAECLW